MTQPYTHSYRNSYQGLDDADRLIVSIPSNML